MSIADAITSKWKRTINDEEDSAIKRVDSEIQQKQVLGGFAGSTELEVQTALAAARSVARARVPDFLHIAVTVDVIEKDGRTHLSIKSFE